MKKIVLALLAIVGMTLMSPPKSNADLIWRFTDDGNGNIRETISGTLDLSGGVDAGSTAAGGEFSMFQTSQHDLVQVHRYSTSTSGRSWFETWDGYNTNPDIEMVVTTGFTAPGWQNTDHLLFQIYNNHNIFRAADFAGTFSTGPTAINEDVVHNVPISFINEGVWRYGNLDDDVEGNGVLFQVGNASIPEPSSCLLLTSLLGSALLRRQRRSVA